MLLGPQKLILRLAYWQKCSLKMQIELQYRL